MLKGGWVGYLRYVVEGFGGLDVFMCYDLCLCGLGEAMVLRIPLHFQRLDFAYYLAWKLWVLVK